MKRTAVFLLFAAWCAAAGAQDVHWSQPGGALLAQNPAFTGAWSRYSAAVSYRSQWNAVNTSYNSYLLAGDYRFGKEYSVSQLSGGAIFYSDAAGDGRYRTTNAGLTLSCLVKLNGKMRMGMGVGWNLVQAALLPEKFSWGSQFNGLVYDPSAPSGESTAAVSKWYSDMNGGLSFMYDGGQGTLSSNEKLKFIAGYSMFHLARPDIALSGGSEKLEVRHAVFAMGTVGLKNKNQTLKPMLFGYRQGKLSELTGGLLMRFAVGERSQITGYKKGSAFSFGALYRVNDAIIPTVQLEKNDFTLGLSYDVNISGLSAASRLRGGIEISLVWSAGNAFLYQEKEEE